MSREVSAVRRRVGSAVYRVVDPRISTASFTYKDAEMRRVNALGKELGFTEPVWSVNDKDAAHAWARELGIRHPALLGEFPEVADVLWEELPARVVLKPIRGDDSKGVYLLHRDGDAWRELASGRRLTPAQIGAELTDMARRGRVSASLLAEELVEDARNPGLPPVDWKILTFFGRVGMIVGKTHRTDARGRPVVRWRFLDDRLRDLGQALRHHIVDPAIQPPAHGEEMVEMASRISAAVPRAFLRVDLYDGVDGPVFGEITPKPGWRLRIRKDVDRWLGELWEDAEARLLVRAHTAGVLEPGAEPLKESALLLGPAPSSTRADLKTAS